MQNNTFQYIDTAAALADYLSTVQDANWVILDTEFIREKTYFPQLCLIQLATEDTLACIDPLAVDDLNDFFSWLQQPAMIKVFHAAWQDLEIIYHLSGKVPTPVFDSQVAAAVLGLGDQMGYARLVESMLGTQLDKSQSRTDWSRRPLKQKQLEYAIDDVRYLRDMYPMLLDQLKQTGRAGWLDKSFRHLGDPAVYEPDPRSCWKRTKGVQILKPKQLSVLRELAAWREEVAIKKNLPRRWLLADEILVDMARMKTTTQEDFSHIRGMKPEQIRRHGDTWLELIRTGLAVPPEEWPELPRRRKPDANMAQVADLLMLVVNKQARASNISPQMIATRSQVEKMLTEGRNKLSDDWRGSLMNEVFADILTGKVTLGVKNLEVVLEKSD
ncbi:MAG: ribonuclease D [Thiolinea sp.]